MEKATLKRFFVPAIVIGVLIFGGLGWFFSSIYLPTAGPLSLAFSALTLPPDLHRATFIAKPFEYRRTTLGYESSMIRPGFLKAIDQNDTSTLRLIKTPEGSMSLFVDGAKQIETDLPIALPALSPNGYIIAYSQSVSESGRVLADASIGESSLIEPLMSASYLYYPATKKTVLLGTGAGPLFLDDTHVIRFSPGGIIATDLATGNETVLLQKSTSALGSPVLQSPDRTLISVTDRVLGKTYVYKVTPTTLKVVSELSAFTPSALSNEVLYVLRTERGKKTLWRHSFDGSAPSKVHTFPTTLKVEALSF